SKIRYCASCAEADPFQGRTLTPSRFEQDLVRKPRSHAPRLPLTAKQRISANGERRHRARVKPTLDLRVAVGKRKAACQMVVHPRIIAIEAVLRRIGR